MDKQDFLAWAQSWADYDGYPYDARSTQVAKFDKKAAELLRNVGQSIGALSSYLKTKLSDTY